VLNAADEAVPKKRKKCLNRHGDSERNEDASDLDASDEEDEGNASSWMLDFKSYVGYDRLMSFYDGLAAAYPHLVSISEEGQTYEGRRLILVKIGISPKAEETRIIWVDAGKFHIRGLLLDFLILKTDHGFYQNFFLLI